MRGRLGVLETRLKKRHRRQLELWERHKGSALWEWVNGPEPPQTATAEELATYANAGRLIVRLDGIICD